jgi:hypothetical protein
VTDRESSQEEYHQLAYYTLSHPDPEFIHQHIVDAFTAQTADENTKPIAVIFALAGLYLFVEKGYTGKQVQQTHVQMARKRKQWPVLDLPEQRGRITVSDVLATPAGAARDGTIKQWCISVWQAHRGNREKVIEILAEYGR